MSLHKQIFKSAERKVGEVRDPKISEEKFKFLNHTGVMKNL